MSLQPTIQYLLSCQEYARLENEILSWLQLFVTLCVISYNNFWFFPRNARWTNQRPAFYDVTTLAVTRIHLPFVFVSSSVRELFAIRASHKLRSFCILHFWPPLSFLLIWISSKIKYQLLLSWDQFHLKLKANIENEVIFSHGQPTFSTN